MSALVAYSSLDSLPLEVTFSIKRAGLDVTFPWSSVGPWALRVGLPPWSGPRARLVGEEGQAEGQIRAGAPVPFLDVDGLRGSGTVALARDTWGKFAGVRRVPWVTARARHHGL